MDSQKAARGTDLAIMLAENMPEIAVSAVAVFFTGVMRGDEECVKTYRIMLAATDDAEGHDCGCDAPCVGEVMNMLMNFMDSQLKAGAK